MKYDVIMQLRLDDLIKEVNQAMASGWKPVGGVSSIFNGAKSYFMQAMLWED